MRYLHTMIRVSNLEESLDFFCNKLGMVETRRTDDEEDRYSLIYLAAPADVEAAKTDKTKELELTYNWETEDYGNARNFGHLAYEVENIYEVCQRLLDGGVTINFPPRNGYMAFVKSPDNISIELLQAGEPLAPAEPWVSMEITGSW